MLRSRDDDFITVITTLGELFFNIPIEKNLFGNQQHIGHYLDVFMILGKALNNRSDVYLN